MSDSTHQGEETALSERGPTVLEFSVVEEIEREDGTPAVLLQGAEIDPREIINQIRLENADLANQLEELLEAGALSGAELAEALHEVVIGLPDDEEELPLTDSVREEFFDYFRELIPEGSSMLLYNYRGPRGGRRFVAQVDHMVYAGNSRRLTVNLLPADGSLYPAPLDDRPDEIQEIETIHVYETATERSQESTDWEVSRVLSYVRQHADHEEPVWERSQDD